MSELQRDSVISFQGLPPYDKFQTLSREEKAILIALLEFGELTVNELILYNKTFLRHVDALSDAELEEFCLDKIERLGFTLIENSFVRYIQV